MTNRLSSVAQAKSRRAHRVRARIVGTKDKPRLHVSVTNKHVSAQIIDDTSHSTMVAISTIGKKTNAKTMTDKAAWVGIEVAKAAKAKKIKTVVFDRGAKLYHGRVKALADAARETGLEF